MAKTRVTVFNQDLSYDDWKLTDVRTAMDEVLSKIPEKFRASAAVEFDLGNSEWGDPASISVYYERPETSGEREKRLQTDRDRKQAAIGRARAHYERLIGHGS